jgi:hypothetical protein
VVSNFEGCAKVLEERRGHECFSAINGSPQPMCMGVPKNNVVRESKCTIAQVNAPVFQCEGVVGLWLPDLKVCCIAFEVIRDRNRRFLREFLRDVFGFAKI